MSMSSCFPTTGKTNLEVTPQNVTATVGEVLTLSCHYPCNFYSQEKYWCKWSSKGCHILPSQDEGARQASVTCDRIISMTLNPVTKEDEGWYWCGLKKGQAYGETTAIYVAVEERTGGESPRAVSTCTQQLPMAGLIRKSPPRSCSINIIVGFAVRVEKRVAVAFLFNLSIIKFHGCPSNQSEAPSPPQNPT